MIKMFQKLQLECKIVEFLDLKNMTTKNIFNFDVLKFLTIYKILV